MSRGLSSVICISRAYLWIFASQGLTIKGLLLVSSSDGVPVYLDGCLNMCLSDATGLMGVLVKQQMLVSWAFAWVLRGLFPSCFVRNTPSCNYPAFSTAKYSSTRH